MNLPAPIIVAGMHRSGTSLIASILSDAGVSMGNHLLPADESNKRGYFEDVELLTLHQKMLHAATRDDDGGHRDWGWTESEELDRDVFAAFRARALALIEARVSGSGEGGRWGWKDPRTTLTLDFWHSLLPDARFLLVYRHPWEVADSMQRLGAEVFLKNPEYAFRIWVFYNRFLLDFYRRHSARAALVSVNALRRDQNTFITLLQNKLGLAVDDALLEKTWQHDLFVSFSPDDPLIGLTAATSPKCAQLLTELDAHADMPAVGLWNSSARLDARHLRPAGPITLSVIIPCYNHGQLLVDAIASVDRNMAEGCELVIVNDGSTEPRTVEVIDTLRAAGYFIVDQPNSGLAAARNTGIRVARGRYILPLDADNRVTPGFMTSAIRVLEAQPEIGVVYTDRLEFGMRSGRAKVREFDLGALLWWNFIDACAVYRREVWEDTAGYDAGASVLEDWEFWIAAASHGWQFRRLPDAAFEYRVRPNSMLATTDANVLSSTREYVFRKHRALYERCLGQVLGAGHAQFAEALGEIARLELLGKDLPKQIASESTRAPESVLQSNKNKKKKTVAALLATHDLPEESVPWMKEAQEVFGELVIFIDRKRVTPGTESRARQVTSRVEFHDVESWLDWDLVGMTHECKSEWVFLIERDEQLSPEWQQPAWRQILETTDLTHFWCPRRWTVPGGKYITAAPWWPDFHLRLFRNNIPGTSFARRLHEPTKVPGAGGCFRNLAIYHHVLWLCSRAVREDRVRYYEQLRPGGGLGHYYLYEDYAPPEATLPPPVKLHLADEVMLMETLSVEEISQVSLKVTAVPRQVGVLDMFLVEVAVTNATGRPISSSPPFPVHITYHWLEKATGTMVVFEGNRTELLPAIPPNSAMQYRATIFAPEAAGEYILQTTMVQEAVCWFENVCPAIVQEFSVSVI